MSEEWLGFGGGVGRRGIWGLFLILKMVEECFSCRRRSTISFVELIQHLGKYDMIYVGTVCVVVLWYSGSTMHVQRRYRCCPKVSWVHSTTGREEEEERGRELRLLSYQEEPEIRSCKRFLGDT